MGLPLEGKVVLVTGAAVRLGRALAVRLAASGATLAVHHHRSTQQAQALVSEWAGRGVRAAAFQADLTQASEIRELVASVVRTLGAVDAVVNSAGVFVPARLGETTLEALDLQWSLNARAPFLLAQAIAPAMSAKGSGHIINVVDVGGGVVPWQASAAYCMSKSALAMLTRCLALELAPSIRVNAVAPGLVLPADGMDPALLETLRQRVPQQRFPTPEEVAETVHFLLTGPASITGQIVAVDGGRSLGMTVR